jgi:hypothetical protein
VIISGDIDYKTLNGGIIMTINISKISIFDDNREWLKTATKRDTGQRAFTDEEIANMSDEMVEVIVKDIMEE